MLVCITVAYCTVFDQVCCAVKHVAHSWLAELTAVTLKCVVASGSCNLYMS